VYHMEGGGGHPEGTSKRRAGARFALSVVACLRSLRLRPSGGGGRVLSDVRVCVCVRVCACLCLKRDLA
jgi:hypothetical protein